MLLIFKCFLFEPFIYIETDKISLLWYIYCSFYFYKGSYLIRVNNKKSKTKTHINTSFLNIYMKIGIIGSGSFGQLLAHCYKDHTVSIHVEHESDIKTVQEAVSHVTITQSYADIMQNDILFLAVPTNALEQIRDAIKQYLTQSHTLILVSKGVTSSGLLSHEVFDHHKLFFISGPMVSSQQTKPFYAQLAGHQSYKISEELSNEYILYKPTSSIKTLELLSILKNVCAYSYGACEFATVSQNHSSLLIQTMITSFLAQHHILNQTFMQNFAGFADLFSTILSDTSKNKQAGLRKTTQPCEAVGIIQYGQTLFSPKIAQLLTHMMNEKDASVLKTHIETYLYKEEGSHF